MNPSQIAWRKSSRSGGDSPQCVEVAPVRHAVAMRDSKDPGQGYFTVSRREFARLTGSIKRGEIG